MTNVLISQYGMKDSSSLTDALKCTCRTCTLSHTKKISSFHISLQKWTDKDGSLYNTNASIKRNKVQVNHLAQNHEELQKEQTNDKVSRSNRD